MDSDSDSIEFICVVASASVSVRASVSECEGECARESFTLFVMNCRYNLYMCSGH